MGASTDELRRPLGAASRRTHGGTILPFEIAHAFVACLTHARGVALKATEFHGMSEVERRLFLKSLRSLDDDLAAIVKRHTGHAYQY